MTLTVRCFQAKEPWSWIYKYILYLVVFHVWSAVCENPHKISIGTVRVVMVHKPAENRRDFRPFWSKLGLCFYTRANQVDQLVGAVWEIGAELTLTHSHLLKIKNTDYYIIIKST